jgi:hypothetical protein
MTSSVDFLPGADPLLRDVPLEHVVTLPILGLPTRFETNSHYVLDVIEEAFGVWRTTDVALGASLGGVRVRIVVHAGGEGDVAPVPVRHLCPDATRLVVHSPGSVAVCDPERRESIAYVTTALAGDRALFRGAMLEAITLALLAHFDRHPIHGAAIAANGRAVILAGPSGAGKSTLAYVAHHAGIDVLSEDRVWVQLDPALRLWGWPGGVRLLDDGASVESKSKHVVTIESRTLAADHATVCVLACGAVASLERVSRDVIAESLRIVDAGFDRFPERHEAVVRALSDEGGWRLTLSSDASDAVPLLEAMLGG